MDVARCLYLAGSEKMKILSKTISFVAFVFIIILASFVLNPHIELYDDGIFMTILLIVVGLFFIRLFLIPRLAERIGKKKRQAVELQEQKEQQIKKYPKIDIITYVLVGVQVVFCLAGFICDVLASHFEYWRLFLQKY